MGALEATARDTSSGATQTDSAIADLNETLARLQNFFRLFKV
jgi:uncharacterized protein YukE